MVLLLLLYFFIYNLYNEKLIEYTYQQKNVVSFAIRNLNDVPCKNNGEYFVCLSINSIRVFLEMRIENIYLLDRESSP